MCGIAGFVGSSEPITTDRLTRMATAMIHRGPDDEGYLGIGPDGNVESWKTPPSPPQPIKMGLAFRRLSILDLSDRGAQPMSSPQGRYWLAFNGQIYNYVELRREMKDVAFRSQSDTEVLLHHLIRHGMEGLDQLKGIFAFAFLDTKTREMWLVRDPLGVKPLYLTHTKEGLWFSSEVRSLLAGSQVTPSADTSLLSRYLHCNWIPDPQTLFEGVEKLPPGHFLHIKKSHSNLQRYWDLNLQPSENEGLERWSEELDLALHEVVSRQMRSDVPLGFFLSGGVDSSLLAVKALQTRDQRPGTFTTGFKWAGDQVDIDLEHARFLSKQFSFDYNEILLEPSVVNVLPKVVETLEEPVADPAALCSYLICEAASERFKVLISGQGADELFGGYPIYQAGWVAAELNTIPASLRRSLKKLTDRLPYSVAGRSIQSVHRIQKIAAASQQPWPIPFLYLRSPFRPGQVDALIHPELRQSQRNPFGRHLELFEHASNWDQTAQMLYLDSRTYLPCLNLAYSDKTSMAHSVELRVPYLDPDVVKLAERIPSRHKVRLREGKVALKRTAGQYLPDRILNRPKAGFGIPLRQWMRNELHPMAGDLLSPERLRRQGWLDPDAPHRLLEEHRTQQADHSMKLYSLMTLQLWLDTFQRGPQP